MPPLPCSSCHGWEARCSSCTVASLAMRWQGAIFRAIPSIKQASTSLSRVVAGKQTGGARLPWPSEAAAGARLQRERSGAVSWARLVLVAAGRSGTRSVAMVGAQPLRAHQPRCAVARLLYRASGCYLGRARGSILVSCSLWLGMFVVAAHHRPCHSCLPPPAMRGNIIVAEGIAQGH